MTFGGLEEVRPGVLAMAKPMLSDELWTLIKPLIPPRKRRRTNPGRKPLDDRQALTGILFCAAYRHSLGILPKEMGCGMWHAGTARTAAALAGTGKLWNGPKAGCTNTAASNFALNAAMTFMKPFWRSPVRLSAITVCSTHFVSKMGAAGMTDSSQGEAESSR